MKKAKFKIMVLILLFTCNSLSTISISDTFIKNRDATNDLDNFHHNKIKISQPQNASWWNSLYNYRVPINITNFNKKIPKGYSVNLSVNTAELISAGKLRADGNDLRILWYNLTSKTWLELNRVNETKFNTPNTQIWFKIQQQIDSDTYDINYFIYYGNPDASNPPTNKSKVYDFYDDFTQNNGPAIGWNQGVTWWVINNEYRDNSTSTDIRSILNSYTVENASIEVRIKNDGTDFGVGILFRYSDVNNFYCAGIGYWDREIVYRECIDGIWGTPIYDGVNESNLVVNQWYILKVDAIGSDYKIYLDGVKRIEDTDNSHLGATQIGFLTWTSVPSYFDDLKIRKLVSSEPILTLNSEEKYGYWFNLNWQYRRKITITTYSAAISSGYTVSLTFNHSSLVSTGKSRVDGDDIRIVYWDGTEWEELDRIIDPDSSWDNDSTKIWFMMQIPIAAFSFDNNYYLYYGNNNATSPPNNANNIFLFYDGFESGNFNAWDSSNTGSPGDILEVSSNQVYTGNYAAKAQVDDVSYNQAIIWKDITDKEKLFARNYLYLDSSFSTTGHIVIGEFADSSTGWENLISLTINNDMTLFLWNDFDDEAYGYKTTNTISTGTWHILDMQIAISNTTGEARLWLDGNLEIEATNINLSNSKSIHYATGYYWGSKTGEPNTIYMDNSYLRLWANPEPIASLGMEIEVDSIPPTYLNLTESSDPLELGNTEIIRINVTDPTGINKVKIEFEGSNHSMTNIGGDIWEYNSWKPNIVGNYTYIIWMEDNCHNWNFTSGTIEVIDTTPPTYSNLIESADPLQLGQNETIEIKVFDLSGVNQTLLEYGSKNHSMVFQGGNKWRWSKWQPTEGFHPYKIYMQDYQNNWNMTRGNITVITTYAPFIENVIEIWDPLELGDDITITVDVYDIETNVSTVFIELDGINRTMGNITGNTYEYIWNSSEYIKSGYLVGPVNYKIYANDSDNNWNSLSSSFDIVDTIGPSFSAVFESDNTLELGDIEIITINCTDLAGINQVKIEFESSDHTMNNTIGNTWEYNSWIPNSVGNYTYIIWMEDNYHNWNSTIGSIEVIDTIRPTYLNLTEPHESVELGDALIIWLNCTDLSGIKDVSIEFENDNHTMTNVGGDIWQYTSWKPNSIGNYTYTIYLTDNNNNMNSVESWILFKDTVIPIYSNFFESADPLELGDNPIIRVNVYDFAGINQTLIQFEGTNHSMEKIYGNTWQYELWTPNNWIVHQYKIFMEDKSGNWNFLIDNITVQDTTPPSPPVLTNSPSGTVSGILAFDWQDGSDPSGISKYRLIIDNEADPFVTPGFVFEINITNTGPLSSYYEYTEFLQPGTYYFFLYQTDGAGHQSSASMGKFSISLNSQPFLFWIILIFIIIISVLASLTVRSYVILPSKRRKESELLTRTQRFKDLRNIQAIIIIHKLSGIPLYSKSYSILEKDQNELFSGFIQALTILSEELSENESVDTEMVEKIIELDLIHFKCLITDEEDVRVAFVLKQKSSERLKNQIREFIMALNLNIYKQLENWDGSLDKFQSLIPSILNGYFELYYKEPFIIRDPDSRAKICKEHELSSMEKHILNVIDSIMKNETSFYLDKLIKLVVEQNENLVIDALESLIRKGLILPTNI